MVSGRLNSTGGSPREGGEQLDKRAGADPAGDGEAVGVVAGEPWPEASQGPREDRPSDE